MVYKGKLVFSAETQKTIDSRTLDSVGGKTKVENQIISEFKENMASEFVKKCLEQNVVVYSVNVSSIEADWILDHKEYVRQLSLTIFYYRIKIYGELTFEVSKPLTQSPMVATWVLWVISEVIKAIIMVLIGYFVVQAIKDWLVSMTTTETIVYQLDENGNVVEVTRTKEPSMFGVSSTLVAFVVVAVVGLYLLFRFLGRKRR